MASRSAIYGRLAVSRMRAHLQYRLSFVLQAIGAFGLSFIDFVAILVIFQHLPHLDGWSLEEVAFLYGSAYTTFKLADIVMTNMDRLPMLIRLGTFDQLLTRPLGSLGQVVTGDLDIRHLGAVAQGALVFSFALNRVGINWNAGRGVVFASMLVSAAVIYGSLFVAMNSIAFWTTDAREVANAFTYGGNHLTQYPLSVFGTWLRRLMAYVIPLGFVNYFPSLYLLSKDDPTDAPEVFRFMSPLAAFGIALVAGAIWRTAVRHYRSTGS